MTISERALAELHVPPRQLEANNLMAANSWSSRNPDGYINFASAENRLLYDLLEPWLTGPRRVTAADTYYQPTAGVESFRVELARYLTRQRGVEVEPDHLVVLAGGTGALDALAYAICDQGDGIVLPTPYYQSLDQDFGARAGARIIPAPMSPANEFALTADVVEQAIANALDEGSTVKAVALLSPNNPLGHVYDASTLTAVAEVVQGHGLQLIVDEVYAGSVYDGAFVSAATLDAFPAERLHLVWGFSKDFGLSGFRIGVVHSTDPQVLAAVGRLAVVSSPSADTQVLLRDLIADADFLARFERVRADRLAEAYAGTTKALDRHGLGYLPARAGLFVWTDLRRLLSEPTYDAEARLWRLIFDTARVNISPGAMFHCAEPGWFRLCFAGEPDATRAGLERLTRVVSA